MQAIGPCGLNRGYCTKVLPEGGLLRKDTPAGPLAIIGAACLMISGGVLFTTAAAKRGRHELAHTA
jgi:hypothetical protein